MKILTCNNTTKRIKSYPYQMTIEKNPPRTNK